MKDRINAFIKIFSFVALFFSSVIINAQMNNSNAESIQKTSISTEPVFWILLSISLILIYVIYALTDVLIYVVKSKYKKQGNNILKSIMIFFVLQSLFAQNVFAVTTSTNQESNTSQIWQDPYLPMYILLIAEGIIILGLSMMIYGYLRVPLAITEISQKESLVMRIWNRINPTVPIEKENDILLEDHTYDGIYELDNAMPPWLKFLFYATIIFAVIYGFIYLTGIGPTQKESYEKQIQFAKYEQEERLKNAQSFVDENTVQLMQTSDILNAGKKTFTTYCATCHGQMGEGLTGPNLTDQYWIHGGNIQDVFYTVKYGVPAKGMASWKEILSPKQISEVSNYIKSIFGTNPPNAMLPQGELFNEGLQNDSSQINLDSISIDTMKIAVQK